MSDAGELSLRERILAAEINVPTRGNRRLAALVAAVNADEQVKGWWYATGMNAQRLGMSDHSWVHIQIVTNISLRLARLLFRRGVEPAMVTDHGMTERDAEVVIAAGAMLHCLGMGIHRQDHERFSLFLAADKLPALLEGIYDEPERTVIIAEALHAIISHRSKGNPFTIEGAIVRVADALDMAKGRARLPFEAGGDEHPLAVGVRDRVREDRLRPRDRSPGRDRDVQQRRHLPGRRGPRHEAARNAAREAHRSRRAHRRRAREAPRAGVPAVARGVARSAAGDATRLGGRDREERPRPGVADT